MTTAQILGFRRQEGEEFEHARKARRILESVRKRLLQPTVAALDAGAAELSDAVQCLEALEAALRLPLPNALSRRALAAEIASLGRELRGVQALAASAGKFYQGWVFAERLRSKRTQLQLRSPGCGGRSGRGKGAAAWVT